MDIVIRDPGVTEKLRQPFQWPGKPVSKAPAKFDPKTGMNVVFLRDILPPDYPGMAFVKYGDDEVVQYLTDEDDELYKPLRFEYMPNVVLQIDPVNEHPAVEYSASDSTALAVSPSTQTSLGPVLDPATQPLQVPVCGQLLVNVAQKMDTVIDTLQKNHAEVVEMNQTTHNWLATINEKANNIFRVTYELHEYPIPRLFVILPGRSSFKDRFNPLVDKYRLYFLCECEHSAPGDGGKPQPHVHFAKHEGYNLERPTEFCMKYGSYILAMFQLLSVAMAAASFSVPAIAGIGGGLKKGVEELESLAKDQLKEKMNQTIVYLKHLPHSQVVETGNDVDPRDYDLTRIAALGGADLRHLASFLKTEDKTQVLANLYRLAGPNGTIKWVCLDHYYKEYNENDQRNFKEFVETHNGTYCREKGKVEIRLSSSKIATKFYPQLNRAPFVHELVITLDWQTTPDDFKEFRKIMGRLPTILQLTVDCCNAQSRLIGSTPSSNLLQVMAGPGLRSFSIKNCNDFLIHVGKLKVDVENRLRKIELGSGIEGRTHMSLLSSLVKRVPQLRHLVVHVPDFASAVLLYGEPDTYKFNGKSVLEAQVETGEILAAEIHGKKIYNSSLEAMDCTKDLSAFSFVTKFTTAINTPSEMHHLDRFLTKAKGLKEIVIEVGPSRFYEVQQFIIQKGKAIQSVYFHDKSKDNSLKMTDIQDPATAEIDLLDDSADFERLLTHFRAAPRLCGKHVTLTNDVFAKLEANTRKLSRISCIHMDTSILDDKGVENANLVIQRSDIAELFISTSSQNEHQPMESTLLWNFIKEVAPGLKETALRIQCPEGQICQFYTFIRSLVSPDMNGQLDLSDGSSSIFLENIQDTRTAVVSMNNDNLGMPLEAFYEMFGCLPSVLGVNTPVSDSIISFLDKTIQPENTTLRRLTFDPSALGHNIRSLALDLIRRCSLDSLDVPYYEETEDLIVQMAQILDEGELTVHGKTETIPDILERLRGMLSSDGVERSLRLTDDSSTIIFDNVSLAQFRLITKGDTTASNELFNVDDILSASQGLSPVITPVAAAKMERWTRSFPSPYNKIRVDASKLDENGIQDMVKVISRSELLSLTVLCSKNEKEEKDKREKLVSLALPYLARSELCIHCPVKNFADMWQLLRAHESPDLPSWEHNLYDGKRSFIVRPNAAPKLVIHGTRTIRYKEDSPNTEGELGDTMFDLGPYLEHLDMEHIKFTDMDAALWRKSTSGILQMRLSIMRLLTTHLTFEGLNNLQNVLKRSQSLAHFAFICDCNQPISTAAIDMLLQNKSTIRELVLKGSMTQQWIQSLSDHLSNQELLPLMTTLEIISSGETLDGKACSWISSMTQAGEDLPGLKKIRLSEIKQSNKFWTQFFQSLDKTCLEELDLSGSSVSEIDICAAGYSLDAPLKILNLKRTNVLPSCLFMFHSLTDGRPLEILVDAPERTSRPRLLEFPSSN